MKKNKKSKKIKRFLILPLILFIGTSVIFIAAPGTFLSSSISEEITWEINNFDSLNFSFLVFSFQTQIRNNNPIPFISLHPYYCYLIETGKVIIDDESYFGETNCVPFLRGGPSWRLVVNTPGIIIYNTQVVFVFYEGNMTEIPNGIYTIWVELRDLLPIRPWNIRSYKTVLNFSDSGIDIWSESPPEFWVEITSSISVFILLIISVYWFKAKKDKLLLTNN
jgi:hypothetical protein